MLGVSQPVPGRSQSSGQVLAAASSSGPGCRVTDLRSVCQPDRVAKRLEGVRDWTDWSRGRLLTRARTVEQSETVRLR